MAGVPLDPRLDPGKISLLCPRGERKLQNDRCWKRAPGTLAPAQVSAASPGVARPAEPAALSPVLRRMMAGLAVIPGASRAPGRG